MASNRLQEARAFLEQCLAPLSLNEFADRFWQRSLLTPLGTPSDRFETLISIAEFDEILSTSGLRHPYYSVHDGYLTLPSTATTRSFRLGIDLDDGVADIDSIRKLYAGGATIALQSLQRLWPRTRDICNKFQEFFGYPTSATVELAPGSARNRLVAARDELFLFQVTGQARVRVWSNDDAQHMDYQQVRTASWPSAGFTIYSGQYAYVPYGYSYECETYDGPSLQLKLSIAIPRAKDFATVALSKRLSEVRELHDFRRCLPFGHARVDPSSLLEAARPLIDRFIEGIDSESALLDAMEQFQNPSESSYRGRILDSERSSHLGLDDEIVVRSDITAYLATTSVGDTLLRIDHREVFIDHRFASAVRRVLDTASFTPRGFPDDNLSDSERLELSRLLVEVGLCSAGREWAE